MFLGGKKNGSSSSDIDGQEKKPTLQSLIYQKKPKEYGYGGYQRQPLVAVVKNSMQKQLSNNNIDLAKKKPIYQSMCSPTSPLITKAARQPNSPSIISSPLTKLNLSRNAGSPLSSKYNGSYIGLQNSPSALNRSNLNTSVLTPSGNDSLEVHGSYFINRSILHSPSTEKMINDSCHSPSTTHIPFITNNKSSTQSVVEALKQKSKRKRAVPESSNELNTKKKKIDDDDIDSTLNDLLSTSYQSPMQSPRVAKRSNTDQKSVTSTGIQCTFDEEASIKRKKQVESENNYSKVKFGLSQNQINELADNLSSTNGLHKEQNGHIVEDRLQKESRGEVSFQDITNTTANDSLLKSVSFATPDKKDKKDPQTPTLQKSSLKLSSLKNMESPYKKLFATGSMQNITPESIKKMRKHPVYFTAKINIDEIQQHHEEYGESGVSLKAFNLDREEAAKRVRNLFDDDDVDFDVQQASASESLVSSSLLSTGLSLSTSSAIPLSTSSSISFSSISAESLSTFPAKSLPASSVSSFSTSSATTLPLLKSSAISLSTSSFASNTFGSTFAVSSTPAVAFSAPTMAFAAPALSALAMAFAAPALSAPAVASSAPAVASSTPAVASSTPAVALSTPAMAFPSVTVSSGLSFAASTTVAMASTTITQFQQAPLLSSVEPPPPATFSFGTSVAPSSVTPSVAVSESLSNPLPPSFSFQMQPVQVSNPAQPTTQNATVPSISFQQPQSAPSSNNLFGMGNPSTQSIGFAPTSVPTVTKELFGATSSTGFSFVPVAPAATLAPTVPSVLPASIVQPTSSTNFAFGGSSTAAVAATTTAATQLPIFNNPTTTAVPMFGDTSISTSQLSMFGSSTQPPGIFNQPVAASNGASALGSNIFATQSTTNTNAGFSFAATSAASTGFNFGASKTAAPAPNAFNVSNPSIGIFGQTAAQPINATVSQNIFGAPAATTASSQGIFGTSTSTQSMFGAPPATSSQNIFAQNAFGSTTQPAFGSSSTSQNAFGTSQGGFSFGGPVTTTVAADPSGAFSFGAATTSSVFGAATTGSVFGGTTTSSVFGGTTTSSVFGGTTTSSGFGAATTSSGFGAATTGSVFGAATTSSVFGGTTTGSVFGQSNAFGSAATSNNNVFGAAKPAENPFGQQAKPSTGGFDFSASLSQGPTINFGGAAAQPQQSEMLKPSFNFGSTPATPTFGAAPPASPAFGAIQQPAFGSPQPFGTPQPAAGGGFTIGSGTSNPPPTRQTQRARRRLRR